jgi:hypothetical protein
MYLKGHNPARSKPFVRLKTHGVRGGSSREVTHLFFVRGPSHDVIGEAAVMGDYERQKKNEEMHNTFEVMHNIF